MKLPLLIPPLLALLGLWPAALAVSQGQAAPIGVIPNGDFQQAATEEFTALKVVPGSDDWLLERVPSSPTDDAAPKPPNPLAIDAEEGPELRLGYAVTSLVTPWIDVPRDVQAIGVWLRAEVDGSGAGAQLSLLDGDGQESHNTLVDVTNVWRRYLVPVSVLAGSSARVRIHPLLSNSSFLDVGHVQPEMLLQSWATEQDRGPLQLRLNHDDMGSFVTVEPSSYPGDEAWLVSSLFSPDAPCSQLQFTAQAAKQKDTLDVVLNADGVDHPGQVYDLASSWHTYGISLNGLGNVSGWGLPLLTSEHELRLRVGVRSTSEISVRDFRLRDVPCGGQA